MVDWAMGKFTYTIDQDSTTGDMGNISQLPLNSLKLTIIDVNCLKTQILLFLIIFVAIADGVFLYKTYLCEQLILLSRSFLRFYLRV